MDVVPLQPLRSCSVHVWKLHQQRITGLTGFPDSSVDGSHQNCRTVKQLAFTTFDCKFGKGLKDSLCLVKNLYLFHLQMKVLERQAMNRSLDKCAGFLMASLYPNALF